MKRTVFLIFLSVCAAAAAGCAPKIANIDSTGETIICFGDSITRGDGATDGNDYPAVLSRKLGMPVRNAGASGETTRDALKRIEEDVLRHNPRLAVVEFSGNDFLQNIPKDETFANLDRIVGLIQEKGGMVVLAQVSAGYFGDAYLDGFKRIAARRQALLVPNILRGIVANPALKSDGIHPNDAGYRIVAERIYRAIWPLLGKRSPGQGLAPMRSAFAGVEFQGLNPAQPVMPGGILYDEEDYRSHGARVFTAVRITCIYLKGSDNSVELEVIDSSRDSQGNNHQRRQVIRVPLDEKKQGVFEVAPRSRRLKQARIVIDAGDPSGGIRVAVSN